jgi:hypothetical protein
MDLLFRVAQMMRPLKNVTLNIRTSPAIRAMAKKLADADQRSIAFTIEKLIRAEFVRMQDGGPFRKFQVKKWAAMEPGER